MTFIKKTERDMDRIETLYLMVRRGHSIDQIGDWIAKNGLRYSNQLVQRTFKQAGRSDLAEYFIKEEDVALGSIVKSRMTGRVGTVSMIKPDGHTVIVKWDTGGSGMVSKESLFKLRDKNVDVVTDVKDIMKPYEQFDNYGDIESDRKHR